MEIDFSKNYNYYKLVTAYKGRVMKSQKYVYLFEEADGTNKKLLGGKGAGLAEMTHVGLPVPPGFIVTTEACLQ